MTNLLLAAARRKRKCDVTPEAFFQKAQYVLPRAGAFLVLGFLGGVLHMEAFFRRWVLDRYILCEFSEVVAVCCVVLGRVESCGDFLM